MNRLRVLCLALLLCVSARAQTVSVTPGVTTYASSGGTLTIEVVLSYTATPSSLGFEVAGMPSGWSYLSSAGTNVPQIRPSAGDTGTLGFAYTSVPAGSVTFSFVLNYPAGLSGGQRISGITGLFRPLEGALQRVAAPNIDLSPAGGAPVVFPPAIVTQPVGREVETGGDAAFVVTASGTGPLTYQWRKDGVAIPGATGSSYTIAAASAASAGSYSVAVGNSAGSITSSAAVLTVRPPVVAPVAPQIVTSPASVSTAPGGSATFSVTATGTAPLTYQWRRDGAPLAGATLAALTLTNVQAAQAGAYSVVVTNAVASVASASATLTVTSLPPPPPPPAAGLAGTYFGTIGGTTGTFALHVRADRTAVFLAYSRSAGIAVVSRDVRVEASGAFAITAPSLLAASGSTATPATAAAAGDIVINGSISGARVVTGTIGGSAATISAPAPATGNTSSAVAGFYQAGAAGSADTAFALVGESGDVFVLTSIGGRVDAGRGTVVGGGAIEVVTEADARVSGVVSGQTGTLTASVAPTGGNPTTLIGTNPAVRTETEKLVNISTRSPVGGAAGALIAGFVVAGDRPKPVLVRAIGPTLASFGVQGVLPAAALDVFRGSAPVASAGDWGAAPQAAAIAAAAARVGAFALPSGSRDSALLLTLEPGAYSAVVRGQGSATGVGLVEVYDATEGPIPAAQRIVNVSTRSQAGTGDASLIAGFNVAGTIPKRVLVRGVGPGLVPFGVTDALTRPQLELYQRDSVLARNAGWGSGDAPALAAAAAQVGAFALVPGSADAALLIHLAPGAYTVHLSGTGGTSGNALIEVYEVP